MTDKELFYRNVMIDQEEEAVVKASKGYGTVVEIILEGVKASKDYGNVVEIILEGGTMETIIRLSPGGAVALGKALADAGDVALRS